MDLSICIVNWNTREDLARCLESIRENAGRLAYEVLVIDNGSSDGSPTLVRTRFPEVRLLANDTNRGFAAANNQGLRLARGRYVLLLNPDTEVHPRALERLVRFLDRRPDAGLVGCRIVNPDGSLQYSCRTFPTLGAILFRGTLLGRLWPGNPYTREYLMQDWPHDMAWPVDWVSGACLAVRREVLEQVGLLDERFFMYCEDMDLARRARDAGWQVYYFPEAVVTHAIGRSSDQNLWGMIVEFHVSMYRYFDKYYRRHYGWGGNLLAAFWLASRALTILLRNLAGRARHF